VGVNISGILPSGVTVQVCVGPGRGLGSHIGGVGVAVAVAVEVGVQVGDVMLFTG